MEPLAKYYFADDAENQMLYYQIIPLLRMSEVYLIAMETSSDLDEINEWYHDYMLAHSVVLNEAGFSALSEVSGEMVNEYRREFYGEGQMFYTYKEPGRRQCFGVTGMPTRTCTSFLSQKPNIILTLK